MPLLRSSLAKARTQPWIPALLCSVRARRGGRRSIFRRNRARPAILVDGDIGKNPLGHRDVLITNAAPRPTLDFHGDRGFADLDDVGVTAHFVADEYRPMKSHGGDRHGYAATLGTARGGGAAGQIHLRQ